MVCYDNNHICALTIEGFEFFLKYSGVTFLFLFWLIQAGNLLRSYGLRFVTSSIDKRELAAKAEKNQESAEIQEEEKNAMDDEEGKEEEESNGYRISAAAAYQIAASAASYLHSHTRAILPFKSSKNEAAGSLSEKKDGSNDDVERMNSEMASFIATTDSVTAVVAAKEEVKQAVADDLNSTHSSPCEWFICDDDQSGTRFFVIQVRKTKIDPTVS